MGLPLAIGPTKHLPILASRAGPHKPSQCERWRFVNLLQQLLLQIPSPLVAVAKALTRPLKTARPQRTRVKSLCLEGKDSTGLVDVLVAGRGSTADYLLNRLGSSPVRPEIVDTLPSHQVQRLIEVHRREDLTVIRGQPNAGRLPERFWRVPDSVVSMIDLDDDTATFGNSDNLRRIRKHCLTAKISYDLSELETFVKRDYEPYVRQRFGALARPHSIMTIAREFLTGGLLWVEHDGVPYAGLVFSIAGDELCCRVSAPVTDHQVAKRIRAVPATKKFIIDYALENGLSRINLGSSRPQLLDGVLQFKKSWGARLEDIQSGGIEWHMAWNALTPAIEAWLYSTPLIVRGEAGLEGVLAIPTNQTEEKVLQHLAKIWSRGIARINLISKRAFDIGTIHDTPVMWHSPRA
jgi:hypothetical protein